MPLPGETGCGFSAPLLLEIEFRRHAKRSLSDVLQDIVRNVQEIVRSEIRLAKTEIREEVAKAKSSTALLGAGAVTAPKNLPSAARAALTNNGTEPSIDELSPRGHGKPGNTDVSGVASEVGALFFVAGGVIAS